MALAFDATATANQASGATLTFSHTCTGTNLILLVAVVTEIATPDVVTGVTYNAIAMTQLGKVSDGNIDEVYLYGLLAPATGANNVVISVSNSAAFTYGAAASYTGCIQSLPSTGASTVLTNSANATTLSVGPITTPVDNCWVMGVADNEAANTTLSSSGILRQSGRAQAFFDTNAPITPAGAYTAQFANGGVSTRWGGVICALSPIPGVGGGLTTNKGYW